MNAYKKTIENDRNRRLILLAEDHPLNQKVALLLLERMGFDTHVVPNGVEAVQAAFKVEYDAILMDCHMPEMDGFEATRAIRQAESGTGRHVPIIAVTALAMAGDRERCLDAGMDDYLTKPIDRDLLRERLIFWMTPGSVKSEAKVVPIFENGHGQVEFKEEPINIGKFREDYGEDAQQLIALFVNSSEQLVLQLDEAIAMQDINNVARLAHELKGASWAVGAEELARNAVFLELAAGQQKYNLLQSTFSRLRQDFLHLKAFVEEQMSAVPGNP